MRSFSISKLRHLILPAAVCLSLTACGTKNYQPEDNYVSTDDSLYENYILSVDEETGPLLEAEKKAFLSVSEIDRNITAEQLKCVEKEYKHYIKNPRGRVTIERFMYRAMPYLDFTKKVCLKNWHTSLLWKAAIILSPVLPPTPSACGSSWRRQPGTAD